MSSVVGTAINITAGQTIRLFTLGTSGTTAWLTL